jgi:hypothetical protein
MASQMSISKCSAAIKDKFKQPDITMDQLKALIQQFIEIECFVQTQISVVREISQN